MNTGNSVYNNYNPDKGRQAFDIASLVMGIISLVLLCTGVLSIPAGALGVLFSTLGKKPGAERSRNSKFGLILSCIGLIAGILVVTIAIYWFYTDPTAVEQVKSMYESYGMEVPEFMTISGGGN